MSFGISPSDAQLADTDCYFYYYSSSCEKGDACPYRHEPLALGKETICEHWLKGNCSKKICPFRHMKITKKRDVIACYYEKQPGGCTKPHCPFLHGTEPKKRSEIPCIHETRPGGCTKPECPFKHVCKRPTQTPFSEHRNKIGRNASLSRNNKATTELLRNLSLNPRNIKQAVPSKKNNFKVKGSTRQAASLENLSRPKLELELVSPNDLVKCLSKIRNFSLKFRVLSMTLKCKDSQVKQTVYSYDHIFVVKKDSVFLRPKLKICYRYTTENGCDEIQDCMDLHICPLFAIKSCDNSNCLFGHILKTNHNIIVYKQFHVYDLSTFTLLSLLRTIGPSVWAMEDNVKICEDYNEVNCVDGNCELMHFCLAFLAGQCLGDDECKLNHNILKGNIITILNSHGVPTNGSSKDIMTSIVSGSVVQDQIKSFLTTDNSNSLQTVRTENLMQMKKFANDSHVVPTVITIWSHHYLGEAMESEICFDSVEGLCQLEDSGCPKLHSTQHFHWQVKEDGKKWVNLRSDQVTALEKAFCDPEENEIELPPLDPTSLDVSIKGLITMMQGRKKWKANFNEMQLTLSGCKPLSIRRLYTRTITGGITPDPCLYSWYFLDINSKWIKYGNVDSTNVSNLKCNCNSDDLEKHYQQLKNSPMIVSSSKFSYSLDFVNMFQTNISTGVQRKMKRRPRQHLIVENTSLIQSEFPSHWESMQPQERAKRVILNPRSEEYTKILNHFKNNSGTSHVHKIERIQNPYLWKTFQNKVQEMTSIYNDAGVVNIQQLFHGTKAEVVDNICKENFDWRLHGSSVGQAYGRGTYFSPAVNVSYGFSSPDFNGYRSMFVAQVAVGTITKGNRTMVRPPLNPSSNFLYDSTVDNVSRPMRIVKYDKQEYYPEYILTLV